MDPFHERLARIALEAAGSYGFALAGGYAIQAHGFLDRISSDVDIFASSRAEFDFAQAVDAVVAACQHEGLHVNTEVRGPSFARLNVVSGREIAKVELGVDWRENEPVRLAVGPVLHADDAVANKVCALFGRAEVRRLHRRGRDPYQRSLYRGQTNRSRPRSRSRVRHVVVRGGACRDRPPARQPVPPIRPESGGCVRTQDADDPMGSQDQGHQR
jgi:hypothetical protein